MKLTAPARGDLIAGVSVALVLIPQSLAYAELAGLPAVHGLYAAAAAPIAAAAIGSSPYLQTGPVALTSLLTLGAIAPLSPTGTAEFAGLAALLALLVGIGRLALGLLRWGALSYLMSVPVVTGFTVAAAVLIIASQVPALVGSDVPASGNPLETAWRAISEPGAWNLAAIGIGALTVLIVLVGRKLLAVFPWVLVVTALGLAAVRLDLIDVDVVGQVPSGLPQLSLALPWSDVPSLLIPALVIAVVGFAEPASIARRYATMDRRPWDPDKEFVGQGLANIGAAVVSGYPVGGSFSRSALNRQSGARTRWSGAITGLAVLAFLPFAEVMSDLPTAVLAGLIIVAAVSLIDISAFREYWRHSRPQFLVALPTFAATLLLAPHIERGLLIGIGLALAVHLWRETRLDVDSWRVERTLYVLPHGVLYFGSAPAFQAAINELLADNPDADIVEIDLHRLGRVDLTGVYALRDIMDAATEGGTTVHFTRIPPHAAERIDAVLGRRRTTDPT
ncbi:MAG TPA: SulP family inorganic anion transporter [Jiangellaceae bacterium]|nr:SulP family inorganic anion transporter [Jiangellaceae bacterium]